MMDRQTGETSGPFSLLTFLPGRCQHITFPRGNHLSLTFCHKRTPGPSSPHSQPKGEKELGSFLQSLTTQRPLQASAINTLRCAAPFLPFYRWAYEAPGGKVSCQDWGPDLSNPRIRCSTLRCW